MIDSGLRVATVQIDWLKNIDANAFTDDPDRFAGRSTSPLAGAERALGDGADLA